MELTETKTIKTALAEMSLLENGLLYINYTAPRHDSIELLKEQTSIKEEVFGTELYVLLNTTKVRRVSREVRSFAATPETLKANKAMAVITGSGVSRIAGNMYLSFNKPAIPTKLFTDIKKAQVWLLERRAKDL